MVKPEQIETGLPGLFFGNAVITRLHEKAAPRSLLGGVRQRVRPVHHAVAAEHGAATFVGKRLTSVRTDGVVNRFHQCQARH
jgi:hypothetical protein